MTDSAFLAFIRRLKGLSEGWRLVLDGSFDIARDFKNGYGDGNKYGCGNGDGNDRNEYAQFLPAIAAGWGSGIIGQTLLDDGVGDGY